MGFFEKLKSGLKKTRESITQKVDELLVSFGKVDEDLFDELEEILITSDIGVDTTVKIIEKLKERVRKEKITNAADVKKILKEEIVLILGTGREELKLGTKPSVIVVIGVNG
ncbi:MAG: signal recognition particle-docking protein FtsY, partial [Clostridiaceae bacterium]|nr:signal recognition particle-docking protein FtsY [Clostridiaceae bacterium]